MFSSLVESLQLMIESSLSDINTNAPGEIISYDAKTNRAVVKLSTPKKLDNGETLESPKIVEFQLYLMHRVGATHRLHFHLNRVIQ